MKYRWSVLFILMAVAGAFAQAPSVEKVEPPNWWAGHTIDTVRVLVRGKDLKNAVVTSTGTPLKVSNIRVNGTATYLFFDLNIPANSRPGTYQLKLKTNSGQTAIPFQVMPRPIAPATITNDDVIYLVMTDRFSDGDGANNTNVDKSNPRMWHGGDIRGVINHLDYLKSLGITALWLTPWYDNSDEVTTCDKPWCPMSSYHGYGAIDYYGVENHFGTMADLLELIKKANTMGIKVIQDQVANHVGYKHPWVKNPPLDNWFTPFVQNRFNNSSLLSPNASRAEVENTLKGWFDFSLPDMNQEEPEVARYEIQNALWWIGMTGISGIRQDTIQYMPRKFIRQWSNAIHKQYPGFYMVGEVFEEDSAQTAFFQGGKSGWDGIDTDLPSDFDFKLWRTSLEVFTGKKPMRSLRDVLKYDGLYADVNRITVMTNNHDTERFMSLPGATKEGAKLHVAFMLATRGIPQLYYGEEVLMPGGHEPESRRDFEKFDRSSRTANEQEMFDWTRQWIDFRKNSRAVKAGITRDLFYDEDAYIFLRERKAFDSGSVAIVAINRSDKPKEVTVNYAVPLNIGMRSVKLSQVIGSGDKFTVGKDTVTFTLRPRSAVAYEMAP